MQNKFKTIRQYYGLSQAQFAQKINVSPGFIANVETERTNVSEKTVDEVCRVFPIRREWLVEGKGEMFIGESKHEPVDKKGVENRVRAVRQEAELTQEEFAKKIGYSKIQIHSVERGKVIPSNQFLEKVANVFSVSYEWLMTGKGQRRASEDPVDDRLIAWLREHPEIARELRTRGGLD